MKKILSIIGTRPEVIKMAPVIMELSRYPGEFTSIVCVSGQHRAMLDQALDFFGITPDYDLNLMKPDQTLADLTGNLFIALGKLVQKVKPDWILAQGDTSTTFVASLIAYYHQIPFGHVEAGLRTNDIFNPFPEEMNRRVADIVATAFFAPTKRAYTALLKEGVPKEQIFITGNTVVDALLDMAYRPYDWQHSSLSILPTDKRLVLLTAHRRESFGLPFRNLCEAIRELAVLFMKDVHFVYPVHLNPNVQKPVCQILGGIENVHLLEPLDYLSLVQLMKRTYLIITDSGGIQEEAPTFGIPVLVLREKTERPEGVDSGIVRLVGTDKDKIIDSVVHLLKDHSTYNEMAQGFNPYGDGKAALRIVKILREHSALCRMNR